MLYLMYVHIAYFIYMLMFLQDDESDMEEEIQEWKYPNWKMLQYYFMKYWYEIDIVFTRAWIFAFKLDPKFFAENWRLKVIFRNVYQLLIGIDRRYLAGYQIQYLAEYLPGIPYPAVGNYCSFL